MFTRTFYWWFTLIYPTRTRAINIITEYVYDDISEYISDIMDLICPIIGEFQINYSHLHDIDLEFNGIIEAGITFEGHRFNLPVY